MLWKTFLGTDIKSQEAQQHEQVRQLPALPLHMASYSRIAIWSRIIEDELTKFRLDILEFCCHMLTRIWPQTMSCLAKLHDEFWCIDVNWKNWSMVHGAICNWWIHPRTHMNLRYLLHLATPFSPVTCSFSSPASAWWCASQSPLLSQQLPTHLLPYLPPRWDPAAKRPKLLWPGWGCAQPLAVGRFNMLLAQTHVNRCNRRLKLKSLESRV